MASPGAMRPEKELSQHRENFLPGDQRPSVVGGNRLTGTCCCRRLAGRDLLQQAQGQMEEQAARGQRRVAQRLLSLSGELRSMADDSGQGGVAADMVQQAAARVGDAGQWLDAREPGQVVHEVQSFARRRPGSLPAAGGRSGPGGCRLTRGLKDATAANSTAKAAPEPVRGHGGPWAQPADVAGTRRQRRPTVRRPGSLLRRPAVCHPPVVIRAGRAAQRTASGAHWSLTTRQAVRARCEQPARPGHAGA